MELKTDSVQTTSQGTPTYYLKLVDQYTNRDVWDIATPSTTNNVDTSYLGWVDESSTDNVDWRLSNPLGEAPKEDEDMDDSEEIEDEESDLDDSGEDMEDEDEFEEDDASDESEAYSDIITINGSIGGIISTTTTDIQETIQQLRNLLLVYDLILPTFTLVNGSPREIYNIELFDKNFERFLLLHLDITKVDDSYNVFAGVIPA